MIGQRLKKILNDRGMMQKELAEKVGVNEMAISRYIHGGSGYPKGEVYTD